MKLSILFCVLWSALAFGQSTSCGVPAITPCVPKPSTNPRCPSSVTRIIGGTTALPNSHPWQALVFKQFGSVTRYCGASIIHANWLLTSANCIFEMGTAGLLVRVGSHSLLESRTPLAVLSVIVHPQCVWGRADYNVALLKLSVTLQFNSTVSPICIDNSVNPDYAGQAAAATGFGSLDNYNFFVPVYLQEVELKVDTATVCISAFGANITPRMFCASEYRKGICYGDSGGPLIKKDSSGRFILIGVSNTWSAVGCVTPGKPSIFTKVSAIAGWIALYV